MAILRLDHSIKHIFIIPGIILAYLLRGKDNGFHISNILLGLLMAICIASANYVINEYLDQDFDRYHPTKFKRSAVQKKLSGILVMIEWLVLVSIGLSCALMSGKVMILAASAFIMQGIIYNVKPVRAKEYAYWDVILEAVNNPIRLIIGWAMIDPQTLPPSSAILCYWLGGAFLMAAKRLSEYREIVKAHGKHLLTRYRASFIGYTESSLITSSFVYALLSNFFLGVFLIKYRIEYILIMPFITFLFAYYLSISMRPGSAAQAPEKLYREHGLIILVVILAIVFLIATFVHIPSLSIFVDQKYIALY